MLRLDGALVVGSASLWEGLHAQGLGESLILGVSLGTMVCRDVNLKALLGTIAPVTVLAAKRLLCIGFMATRKDMGFQVTLSRRNVDTLRTVPSLTTPGHLWKQIIYKHGR